MMSVPEQMAKLLLLLWTASALLESDVRSFRKFEGMRASKVWYAEGELSDPATGQVHAKVRGVETSLALPTNSSTESRRAVAKSYAYDSREHTYGGIVTQKLQDDGQVACATQLDNGRTVIASKAKFAKNRFEAYVAPDGSVSKPPPMVQFAATNAKTKALSRAQKGLRCRETYTLQGDVLTYSRFGECPAWVGPGKLCALDLTMRPSPAPYSWRRPRQSLLRFINRQASTEGGSYYAVLEDNARRRLDNLVNPSSSSK